MSNQALLDALARAERAIERVERAADAVTASRGREDKLRATVRDVVSELDSILGGGR
jgi:hypothetical protein